jgi:hypothetical protein
MLISSRRGRDISRRGTPFVKSFISFASIVIVYRRLPRTVHARRPLIRPSDGDLDEIAAILNESKAITIYAGSGCAGAHDEVITTAARLKELPRIAS